MEANNQNITMIVRWNDQLREINININDDLNTIATAISNIYQLREINIFHKYQIQYYHSGYQKFMDLYSESFHRFQELLYKLLSSEAPPKSTKEWVLKIVVKATESIRCTTINETATDDTYTYQQENDPRECLQNHDSSLVTNHIQSASQSIDPRSNNLENIPKQPTLENNDENQEELERSTTVNSQIIIPSDHPYQLQFADELGPHQRQQYERDMTRNGPSHTTNSGVRLQACPRSNATNNITKCYPKVQFNIPADQHNLSWYLHLCILTEADINGCHYLHASKGIYDRTRETEDKFGMLPNSKLYSPYVVKLSPDDLRKGEYEIMIKVCNRKNVVDHASERLREFSRLDTIESYDDQTSLSDKTTHNLQLSSAKYHLACSLFCEGRRHDQCISCVTTAVPSGKPYESDESKQGVCGHGRKKNQQK